MDTFGLKNDTLGCNTEKQKVIFECVICYFKSTMKNNFSRHLEIS